MKQLTEDDLYYWFDTIDNLQCYINEVFSSADDFSSRLGLFYRNAELKLYYRIYKELQVECPNMTLPIISLISNDEDDDECLDDEIFDIQEILAILIECNDDYLKSFGWEEVIRDIYGDSDYDNENGDIFGDFDEYFMSLIDKIPNARNAIKYLYSSLEYMVMRVMKNHRLGEWMNFVKNNTHINFGRLPYVIELCAHSITNPYHRSYPYAVINRVFEGTFYSLSITGEVFETTENIDHFLGFLGRKLLIEMLDQLLDIAEQRYYEVPKLKAAAG